MDRDYLARILIDEREAFAACRQAVMAGARFWVAEDSQPASTLVAIYARRERVTRERGIATAGFAEAVAELRARGEELVRIGAVDIDEPPWHFQLFLDAHAAAVLACLAVDQSSKLRDPA